MNDFLDEIVVCLIIAFFASVPLMFIFRVCYKYFIGMFMRKKKLQKAKEMGHIVKADCVKKREPVGIPEPTDKYFATYSFEFNGKVYKRRFNFLNSPPSEMTLYFYKKPSKAEPESTFIGMETGLFPFYIFGFVIIFVLLIIFGIK